MYIPKGMTFKTIVGICLILFSYIIGWPAVAFFAWLSFRLKNPLWIAIGGPVIYGISTLVFLWGAYMVGERHIKVFWKWGMHLISHKVHKDEEASLLNADTTDRPNDK